MMPTSTYTAISSIVAPGGTSELTFTSIPATYSDLALSWGGNSGAYQILCLRFNGDSGSNYYSQYLLQSTSPTAGFTGAITQGIYVGNGAGSSAACSGNASISDYKSTTTYKTATGIGFAATNDRNVIGTGMWINTSAITSVTLRHWNGGNFNAGFTVSLYGILEA